MAGRRKLRESIYILPGNGNGAVQLSRGANEAPAGGPARLRVLRIRSSASR